MQRNDREIAGSLLVSALLSPCIYDVIRANRHSDPSRRSPKYLCMREFRLITFKMGHEWLPGKLVMASFFSAFYCLGLDWDGELPFCTRRIKANWRDLGWKVGRWCSWCYHGISILVLDSLPPNSFMEKNDFSWVLAIILRVWSKPRWSLCNELDLIVTKI